MILTLVAGTCRHLSSISTHLHAQIGVGWRQWQSLAETFKVRRIKTCGDTEVVSLLENKMLIVQCEQQTQSHSHRCLCSG